MVGALWMSWEVHALHRTRRTQPFCPAPLHLASHTDILDRRSAIPERIFRPGLHYLPRSVLVLRASKHPHLPLPTYGTVLSGGEG